MEKKFKAPFLGDYNDPNKCRMVLTEGGNFMWDAMQGYHWFHQSRRSIHSTINGLQEILRQKEEMLEWFRSAIDDFDWTYMYSDDGRPGDRQRERNKEFNKNLKLAPEDIKIAVYKHFITKYMDNDPHPFLPISYEKFKEGINV